MALLHKLLLTYLTSKPKFLPLPSREIITKMKESHLKSLGLDVDRLESELKQSVRHEERRWRENDAKLRAVEQKVGTYDEFRGIVDACELRPLTCKEIQEATNRYAGWAPNSSTIAYSIPEINQEFPCFKEISIKRFNRIDEFMRCWSGLEKNQSNIDLFNLLKEQSNELLQEIFASSTGLSILSRVLNCLQVAISRDSSSVVRILQTISSSKNFDLTAMLMSDEEKNLSLVIELQLSQTNTYQRLHFILSISLASWAKLKLAQQTYSLTFPTINTKLLVTGQMYASGQLKGRESDAHCCASNDEDRCLINGRGGGLKIIYRTAPEHFPSTHFPINTVFD
ncbi:hypothetical protein ACTXT7_012106 [Hymenolepis weldensis]